MRKFLTTLFLILFLLVTIIFVVKLYIPYYWGNAQFATKILYLKNNPSKFNAYFFGSSVVHHQINPKIFDSIVNTNTSKNIRSFNLGSPATLPPQSYYLYEKFLKKDINPKTKYVFMHLKNLAIPSRPIRDEYWQNASDIGFLFKVVYEEKHLSIRQKIAYYRHTVYRYVKNSFADNQLGTYLFSEDFHDPLYLGKNKDGFLSLDYQYMHTTHLKNKIGMEVLREQLLDTNLVTRKISSQEVKKMLEKKDKLVSKTHLRKINHLIEISKSKGIELIFFISPKSTNQHLIDLYKKIPENHRLEFSQTPQFIELFEKDNLYDAAHANEKGAALYSKIFANKFLKMIN